jgi:hypothetical protein
MTALLDSGSRAGRIFRENALNRLTLSHINFVSRLKIVVGGAYKRIFTWQAQAMVADR